MHMEQQIISIVDTLKRVYNNFEQEKIVSNLEESIEFFGIDVQYSDLKDEVCGYSSINPEGHPVIVVNGNHPLNRRRFTMAHELGHVVLHWKWLNRDGQKLNTHLGEVLYRAKSCHYEYNEKERQANMFAVEFLVPIEKVKKILDGKEYSIMDSEEKTMFQNKLVEKFKISKMTAKIQLEKTDEI